MPIQINSIRSVDHFLAQKVQLADTDAAMMSTSAREPMLSPKDPTTKREEGDDAKCDRSIVERLAGYWIDRGETKDDSDENNPETCDCGDGLGSGTQMEGTAFEVSRPDDGHGYGDAIREIQTYCGD